MKAVVLAVLAATLPLVAQAAVPEQVRFTGVVVSDDAVAVNFDLVVPRGKRAALELDNGTRLELNTRGVAPDGEGARMRLLAPDGGVMHQAGNPDPAVAELRFGYRVCEGRTTYMNPLPETVPSCP